VRVASQAALIRYHAAGPNEGNPVQQIALILVCLAIGVALRLSGRLPDSGAKVLGGWVINVALPAAALHNVHQLSFSGVWLLAAATPWVSAALAVVVLVPLCRALGWPGRRTGALLLIGGWGNTSFVGLPMIAAFAGNQWLGLGMVIDLFGSYLALSTLGLAIATIADAGRFDWRFVARRIVTFPPFIAILVALAINDVERPEWLIEIIDAIARTTTPVALATVGFALRLDKLPGSIAPLFVGLGYRLLLAPLALLLIYTAIGQASDMVAKVAILEMAMPPMLGASIIAMDHGLEPELVALIIGIGVPLSMLTATLWWTVIASW
jgi:malate permease and related proteins